MSFSPGRGTRMATMPARFLRTALTIGSLLRRSSFLGVACAEANGVRSATARMAAQYDGFFIVLSIRQPGDLREAHSFPPPPRDGFSFVVDWLRRLFEHLAARHK